MQNYQLNKSHEANHIAGNAAPKKARLLGPVGNDVSVLGTAVLTLALLLTTSLGLAALLVGPMIGITLAVVHSAVQFLAGSEATGARSQARPTAISLRALSE